MVRLTYGSARFSTALTNNVNAVFVGGFDLPTKLVDARKDVALCLPEGGASWGNYPTHQSSWLSLAFVAACHAAHEDEAGLGVRRAAWEAIPAAQWPALAAKAVEFAAEFRGRLALVDSGLGARKAFKSATRALQDCLLYAAVREFPADQDGFLEGSPLAGLVAAANRGRAGELSSAQGFALADEIDALVASLVAGFGGIEACKAALAMLQADPRRGRVILLPEGVSLFRGAELVRGDVVVGTPDAHDMDIVSIVEGQGAPELVQLTDQLSGQRLDIMAVSASVGSVDQLSGGHPAFQSVAEMALANGSPRTAAGRALLTRLAAEVKPEELAKKYRTTARDFFFGGAACEPRKSWEGRRAADGVPQVKKVIPLYRVASDLLPRAAFMERTGTFPCGQDMASLAEACGLGDQFRAIRSILDRQDATQAELEALAESLKPHL